MAPPSNARPSAAPLAPFGSSTYTAVFSHAVRDHMEQLPPRIKPETPIAEAARLLSQSGFDCLLVATHRGPPLGILTLRDVLARVAFETAPREPVADAMSSPLITIREDDYLFRGIALMRRHGLNRLPVTGPQGDAVGLLRLEQALTRPLGGLFNLVNQLTHEETEQGLLQVKQAQVTVAETLLEEGAPAPEVQGLLTHINRDIHRRVIGLIIEQMADEGWGDAPTAFAAIVMGSGGRGESLLFPDQDNGFILADYPLEQRGPVETYFIELAERMNHLLHKVGFDFCKGHVMAQNPLWRKTLPEWKTQVNLWLARPSAASLRLSDIFFDFAPVFGPADLHGDLRRHVTETARKNPSFLNAMYALQAEHGVALTLFGGLQPETKGINRGRIDFKLQGLTPLVESLRLFALREGIPATGALERIAALHHKGLLDHDVADRLSGAFNHLTGLILRQQIEDFKQGREMGPFVPLKALSERETTITVESLQAIKSLRNRIKAAFSAEM